MHSILHVHNIRFERDRRTILDDISWQIAAGSHWALIGANGSGKTTLLKILTGYAWPTSGTVSVLGRQFGQCDLRKLRRHIGYVSTSLDGDIPRHDRAVDIVVSGYDASLGLYRAFSDIERHRARTILEHLGADAIADQPYHTLSQGEQQRVRIGRALVHDPALLILDEPCAGLDPVARKRLLDDITSLAKSNYCPTVLLVTHHLEEIRPWISHVLALQNGAVAASGTTNEVLCDSILSSVFHHPCRVHHTDNGWSMTLA